MLSYSQIKIAYVIVICTQIGKDYGTIKGYGTFRANTHTYVVANSSIFQISFGTYVNQKFA